MEPYVVWSVSLPNCTSWFICTRMWDHLVHQPLPCHTSSLSLLPISAPPTNLDECFFFNSLVVQFPYSLIFWQFWLVFVFKLFVILLLVVQDSEAYLPMPPCWPEAPVGLIEEFPCFWVLVTGKLLWAFDGFCVSLNFHVTWILCCCLSQLK